MTDLAQPLKLTEEFTLPSRALLSPMEGVMDRESFFQAVVKYELTDSWMTPFLGVNEEGAPSCSVLKRKFAMHLASGLSLTVQLSGHCAETLAQTAARLYQIGVRSVNLNCACPSKTVLSSSSGGALLREPERIRGILQEIRKAEKRLCVSVKLRTGFSSPGEFAKIAEAVRDHVSFVIVHFRTVREGYRTVPEKEKTERLIRIREAFSGLPFFANGDIRTVEDARRICDLCACDGIAAGRGLPADPFLLRKLTGKTVMKEEPNVLLSSLRPSEPPCGKRHHVWNFYLECARMAYGESSEKFRLLLRERLGSKK